MTLAFRSALLKHGTVLALILALLAGCAATPPPVRYLLPPDGEAVDSTAAEAAGSAASEAAPATLRVPAPRLAGYLDSAGIVLQLDDITLNQANGHRWAEDLGLQLQRGLRQRLGNRLPELRVLGEGTRQATLELRLDLHAFHGYAGAAVAAGHWQLYDAQGALLTEQDFHVQSELDADGYPALVRALGRSLDRSVDGMATAIEAVLFP